MRTEMHKQRISFAHLPLLLTIFPMKPGVTFLTGSPSSVPYTMKLEPGIFVISMDFGTGQSISKFGHVTSVYRKIWTIVRGIKVPF